MYDTVKSFLKSPVQMRVVELVDFSSAECSVAILIQDPEDFLEPLDVCQLQRAPDEGNAQQLWPLGEELTHTWLHRPPEELTHT